MQKTSNKGLLSKTYREFLKPNVKKTNSRIKKWAKDLNRHFTKEDIQMTSKHMKCFISHVIREMQIKAPMRYCYTRISAPHWNNDNTA